MRRWKPHGSNGSLPYYTEFSVDPPDLPPNIPAPFNAEICDAVVELKPEVVSFHFGLPEKSLVDRLKAAGCSDHLLCDDGHRSALARGPWSRRHYCPRRRGWRPPRYVLDERPDNAGRYARSRPASRRCGESSGHRGGRNWRWPGYRRGARVGRVGRANGDSIFALPRGDDFPASSRRHQVRERQAQRRHQCADGAARSCAGQSLRPRGRTSRRRCSFFSARRACNRTAAQEGGVCRALPTSAAYTPEKPRRSVESFPQVSLPRNWPPRRFRGSARSAGKAEIGEPIRPGGRRRRSPESGRSRMSVASGRDSPRQSPARRRHVPQVGGELRKHRATPAPPPASHATAGF